MALPALIGAGGALGGGIINALSNRSANQANIEWQRKFAKTGIQWRVQDAEKAGVHPLYALGANTHSFSPSSVGDTSLGNAVASAGQNLGRAAAAVASAPQRALDARMAELQVKNMELNNDLLASRIATTLSQIGPAAPSADTRYGIDGQAQSVRGGVYVEDKPFERTATEPGKLHQEPFAIPDVGYARTQSGYHPVYSSDVKERLEEDTIGMLMWNLRNRVLPTWMGGQSSPPYPVTGDDYWRFNPRGFEYQRQSRHRDRRPYGKKGGGW